MWELLFAATRDMHGSRHLRCASGRATAAGIVLDDLCDMTQSHSLTTEAQATIQPRKWT